MTVRRRGDRWSVEVYDGTKASKKRYVGTYDTQLEGRAAERDAEALVARRRGRRTDETVAGFAGRWLDLNPRQKESTNIGYREQVAPFAARFGTTRLRDFTVEMALEWAGEKRWTLGGVRAMFSDARRAGLVDENPFTGLRLRGSRGRKDIVIPSVDEIERLAACAVDVWAGEVALTMRALILNAAFVGMRPGEMYGLRWSDLNLRDDEVTVARQRSAATRTFELPKNGQARTVVLTAPAKAALLEMPRPVNATSWCSARHEGSR